MRTLHFNDTKSGAPLPWVFEYHPYLIQWEARNGMSTEWALIVAVIHVRRFAFTSRVVWSTFACRVEWIPLEEVYFSSYGMMCLGRNHPWGQFHCIHRSYVIILMLFDSYKRLNRENSPTACPYKAGRCHLVRPTSTTELRNFDATSFHFNYSTWDYCMRSFNVVNYGNFTKCQQCQSCRQSEWSRRALYNWTPFWHMRRRTS